MKRGGALMIVLVILSVLFLVIAGAVFYFYNFHVFKSVRLCTGEAVNTQLPCGTTADCVAFAEQAGLVTDLGDVPIFIQEGFDNILDDAIYCDETCFMKEIRGINPETQELEMLESCNSGETSFVFEIKGKEGIAVLKWMKKEGEI